MRYIEAPVEYRGDELCVFLAGGISDAEDWQSKLVSQLDDVVCTILNPRRATFPMKDLCEGQRQIEWEWRHLDRADLIVFWFPPQTICPIALFELGTCCSADVPLVVGSDPNYARRFDLEMQLRLRRPDVALRESLVEVAADVARHPILTGRKQ